MRAFHIQTLSIFFINIVYRFSVSKFVKFNKSLNFMMIVVFDSSIFYWIGHKLNALSYTVVAVSYTHLTLPTICSV